MNFFRFRSNLFCLAVSRHVPEGCILPWWALGLRTVLFPLEMLGYLLSRPNHYDVWTDTYLIHGVRYAGELFRAFAAPNEESLYRLKRMGDVITIERVTLPVPKREDVHYAWELHDAEGEWQAGGSANSLEDVQREGNRYLQTYSQDGPHKLIIERHCVTTIEPVPKQEGEQ